jgi:hypothetical protein
MFVENRMWTECVTPDGVECFYGVDVLQTYNLSEVNGSFYCIELGI